MDRRRLLQFLTTCGLACALLAEHAMINNSKNPGRDRKKLSTTRKNKQTAAARANSSEPQHDVEITKCYSLVFGRCRTAACRKSWLRPVLQRACIGPLAARCLADAVAHACRQVFADRCINKEAKACRAAPVAQSPTAVVPLSEPVPNSGKRTIPRNKKKVEKNRKLML